MFYITVYFSLNNFRKSMTMTVVHVLVPSCVCPSEADTPVCRIGQRLAAHMQPVEAGQEEGEGAEGVEEGDGGIEQEAGEAGEDAEEGQDAEESDGGPCGD